jgi:hypothetical protein
MLALWPVCGNAAGSGSLEDAVKATFLSKFAGFVEWPAGSAANGAFVLCAVGNDAVTALMDRAAAGQRVGERPIAVRHLQQVSPADGCDAAYLAGSATQSAEAAAAILRGTPVLTVADSGNHPGVPAIIKFVVADGRVRFDVDDAEAAGDHLVISSRLLDLARKVRKRP